MEQYYYNHMDKQKQAAYHTMLQGIRSLADEFQIPAKRSLQAVLSLHYIEEQAQECITMEDANEGEKE